MENEKIKELKNIIEKLRLENNQLKNRCYASTLGELCKFCQYDCKMRNKKHGDYEFN